MNHLSGVGVRLQRTGRLARSSNARFSLPGGARFWANYVAHRSERSMSITWRLRHAMPAELFEEMKVAAG